MLKLRVLFVVMLLLLVASCSDSKESFYGKWINPNHRSESLTFQKDGSFIANSGRESYKGFWNIYDEGYITMVIDSDRDSNIHTARYDAATGKLIITIAGNDVVMQRADER
jgi:hypothetical protein